MQNLFSEFKPATAADWKNQMIKDLKGEAYENLVWHNENGFTIDPFYTGENLKQDYEPAFTHADWEISVQGKSLTSSELNNQLLRDLENGATSGSIVCGEHDLEQALQGIQLNFIASAFFVNETNAAALKAYLQKQYTLSELNTSIFMDINSEKDLAAWKTVHDLFGEYANIRTLCANVLPYHNQNGFAYYEVAIALSAVVEFLEILSKENRLPASAIVIKTGVSADYFVQIAKLRAIRRLWALLKKEYTLTNDLYMIVETSLTNKSISDSYNNLLRTTVEAMAAVAGGCNELVVKEFDTLFPTNPALSERMAINQQLILKDESYLDKIADVSCGSFYIESITDAIAAKALEAFKRFENEGGYLKCIKKNSFASDLELQAQQREEAINSGKQLVIGVNKFRNEKEKINVSATDIVKLEQLPINNPTLNFELEHYFQNA